MTWTLRAARATLAAIMLLGTVPTSGNAEGTCPGTSGAAAGTAVKCASEGPAENPIYAKRATLQETLLVTRGRYAAWLAAQPAARAAVDFGPWQATPPLPLAEFDKHVRPSEAIDFGFHLADGRPLWSTANNLPDGKAVKFLAGSNTAAVCLSRTIRAKKPVRLTVGIGGGDRLEVWLNRQKVAAADTRLPVGRYGTGERVDGTRVDQMLVNLDLQAGENGLVVRLTLGGEPTFFFSASPNPVPRIWEQVHRDFPAVWNPMLELVPADWFDTRGWFAARDSQREERLIERLTADVGDAGTPIRAELTRLRQAKAPCDDHGWLDLCVQASVLATLQGDLARLRRAVEALGKAHPDAYPAAELIGQINAYEQRLRVQATARLDPSHEATRRLMAELPSMRREMLVTRNPLLRDREILFVKRYTYNSKHYYDDFQHINRWGGNLCVLSLADGRVRELAPSLAGGVFDRYDLSFDAQRVAFGYRRPKPEGFRIYEIGVDGQGLRPVTRAPVDEDRRIARYGKTSFGDGFYGSMGYRFWTDDVHPCYLPDGGLCFASSRCEHGVLCTPSHYLACTTLFRIDADGGGLRPLSQGALSEFTPTMMDDGRILYNRWEYVYKGIAAVQSLWTMRPDGSGSEEFYGNNIANPGVLWQARQVPGHPRQAVCIGCGHEPLGIGPVLLVDLAQGKRTSAAMTSLTPTVKVQNLRGLYQLHNGVWREDVFGPFYADPCPLSDQFFLVSCNPNGRYNDETAYGIYLLDVFGNRVPIYHDAEISCWQPMLLRPRKTPPVLPAVEAESPTGEATATVFLSDVYRGLEGVKPGTVKYLRVMEQIPKPWAAELDFNRGEDRGADGFGGHLAVSWNSHIWIAVLRGIVPVEEDGSACFEVPARRNLFFQALDEEFMEVQRMRTFINFEPGEQRSCIGCHEHRTQAPEGRPTWALRRSPAKLAAQPGEVAPRPLYYPTDVQPILDRRCVRCHNGKDPKAAPDLRGELTTLFNRSYENLLQGKLVNTIQEWNSGTYAMQNAEAVPPYTYGSHRSKLVEVLRKGHYDARLTKEEWIKLVTWIDSGAAYYGSYFGRRHLKYQGQPDFRPVPTLRSACGLPPEPPDQFSTEPASNPITLMTGTQDSLHYAPLTHRNDEWYGSTFWTGPDWTRVGKDWQHPGQNTSSIRRFTCPAEGRVTVTGPVYKAHLDGDGVRVSVLHGRKTVWQAEMEGRDDKGVEPKVTLDVRRGDAIRFVVHKRRQIACDTTHWDPVITYADGRRFQASASFADRQGKDGWWYEMEADGTTASGLPKVYSLRNDLTLREDTLASGRPIRFTQAKALPLVVVADETDTSGLVLAMPTASPWQFQARLADDGRLSVQFTPGEKQRSADARRVCVASYRGPWLAGLAKLQHLLSSSKEPELAPLKTQLAAAMAAIRLTPAGQTDSSVPELDYWAMIQADWQRQDQTSDKIESYAAATKRHLEKARQLLADLRAEHGGNFLAEAAAQLDRLAAQTAKPASSLDEQRLLYLQVRWQKRRIALANPRMNFGPVLFSKRVPTSYSHLVMQYFGWRARPGGGLFILDKPGESLACRDILAGKLAGGNVLEPRLSYDAKRIVFSYVDLAGKSFTPNKVDQQTDEGFYHIYEVNVDGTGLRQLTRGPYDDLMPTYLPDGGIALCSTRRQGYARCFGGQFGPRWHVYTLHRMDGDGSNLHTLSVHDTNEWFPAVSNTGHILYARWDYIDRDAVTHQNLWSSRPDGTSPQAVWGNATAAPHCAFQAQPIPDSNKIIFTASAHHSITGGAIAIVDPAVGADGMAAITRVTPEIVFPEAEGRDIKEYYSSPWPLSEKYYLVSYSPTPLVWEPRANNPAALGIYYLDAWGNRELIYRDPEIGSENACPLVARTVPPVMESSLPPEAPAVGEMLLTDVYEGLGDVPRGSIKALRIVQVFPKTTIVANSPPVGLAGEENGRAILGTVPVETDGSARFLVPAHKPILFQALDQDGFAYQTMRTITYVQPGERISCIGCHENRRMAPPSRVPMAQRRRPSPITPGELGGRPFSYVEVVQPILDQHCVKCHAGPKTPASRIDLTGTPEKGFSKSYWALCGDVNFWGSGTNPENAAKALVPRFGGRNQIQVTSPGGMYGALGSRLMKLLRSGHEDVKLSRDELARLAAWIDLNALFYGVNLPEAQAQQLRGERLPMPEVQ